MRKSTIVDALIRSPDCSFVRDSGMPFNGLGQRLSSIATNLLADLAKATKLANDLHECPGVSVTRQIPT